MLIDPFSGVVHMTGPAVTSSGRYSIATLTTGINMAMIQETCMADFQAKVDKCEEDGDVKGWTFAVRRMIGYTPDHKRPKEIEVGYDFMVKLKIKMLLSPENNDIGYLDDKGIRICGIPIVIRSN